MSIEKNRLKDLINVLIGLRNEYYSHDKIDEYECVGKTIDTLKIQLYELENKKSKMKKLYFQDEKNQQGVKIINELKQWCNNQECVKCIFSEDLTGCCQLTQNIPCKYDTEEIYDLATSEMLEEERYGI